MYLLTRYRYRRRQKSLQRISFRITKTTLRFFQSVQLRLTVAEAGEPRAYSVGHVIVGGEASGRALAHWRQMLTALRRPVAMWHPLRK